MRPKIMSDEQFNARLGALLRDFAAATKDAEEARGDLHHLATCLSALALALRVEDSGEIANPARAAQIIADLPEDLSPGVLRRWIADYQEKAAKLAALRTELKPYRV
jgi:hypothetical protein